MVITTLSKLRRAAALALAGLSLCGGAWAQSAANGKVLYNKVFVTNVGTCAACHYEPKDDAVMAVGASANALKQAVMNKTSMKKLNGFITDAEFNDLAAYISGAWGSTPTYIAVTAAPSVSISATSLSFTAQNVGSASAAQTVTVSNAASATGALSFTSIATTAGSDFSVSGGTCSTTASVAAGGSCTVNVTFKPSAAGTRNGALTLAHNGAGGKSEVSLSGSGMSSSPVVSVSPATLTFSGVVGTATAPMRATISNTGSGNLVLSALMFGGTNASDYGLASSSTCGANTSIAGGSSCVLDIVFTAGATGARSATLTVAHNATGSPTAITLMGTGTATATPGIALDATTLDLGNQPVEMLGTSKTVTLTNSGGAALTLGNITLGGTDASSFVLGGTCAANASVAVKGTCTITVAMKPLTLGAKSATLSVASNAPTGTATVALKGVAVRAPAPEVGLSQAALDFGTVSMGVKSIARTVTLTNTGSADLTITSIASTSTEFAVTHNCPSSLAAAASCVISVTLTPVSANLAEAVVITTNALSSPNSIALTGLGTTATMPVLAWQQNSASLKFDSTVVGMTSASQSLTLVNQGPGAALINSLGVAGTDASSFAIGAGSTCKAGVSLDANASCTVVVSFVPGSTGAKTANLQVSSNASPPGDVALSGSGASPSTPSGMITVSQTTLDFSSIGVVAGQTSTALTVTVNNGSAAAVTVSKIAVSGQFSIVAASSNSCATSGVTLAAGGSCNVAVVFSPNMAGSATGTLTLTTSTNQTVEVTLKGQANAATPKLAWQGNTTSQAFSSTVVGQTSSAQTLTLTNPGTVAATLSGVTLSGTDAASFAIGSSSTCKANLSLAANATCTVVLTFTPASAGAKSATLKVGSNATSPGDVVLSGSGMTATPTNGMLTVDKSALDFSGTSVDIGKTSAAMNVTVANGNVAAVTLSKVEVTGSFKVSANTCPVSSSTIAVNANCTVSVTFVPTAAGMATGNLTLTTATGQVLVVSLKGLATATASAPVLVWQTGGASTLQFDSADVGKTSAAKSVTLLNQGSGTVNFSALETDGNDKAQFLVTSDSTCKVGTPLAQGASCQLVVAFMPTSAGSKSATLRIASNATAPATMMLSGLGNAASTGTGTGLLWVDYKSLGFMAGTGSASAAQTLTVKNQGTAPISLSTIVTTGPFQVVNSASGGCVLPQQLAAGASCVLSVVFNGPQTAGDSTGTVVLTGASGDSLTVSLTGRAVATNVGGSGSDDKDSGGGAASPWALLGLLLAGAVLSPRRRKISNL